MLRHIFDLWLNCDLELGRRNLNHVRDTLSHYALSFCEVSSNLLQKFMSYRWDTICNGRTDWRTDGAILICLPKFLKQFSTFLQMGTTQRAYDLKWHRVNVDATIGRRIDVDTTSFWDQMPARKFRDFLFAFLDDFAIPKWDPILQKKNFSLINPLYTGGLFHCYTLDESIC